MCLLAQAVVTDRGTGESGGCDESAADTGREHLDLLHAGCCCGSGAPCSPDCDQCVCCPHQRPMMLQAAAVTPILDHFELEYGHLADPVQRPRADEILHVPRTVSFV
jgi:hypothetical protein